jgi:Uma2 family endonuclease
MSAQLPQNRKLTPDEYLALEEKADFKSEYWDGTMIPLNGEPPTLAGASENHVTIALNIASAFRSQLRGKCRVYMSDMKVWIESRRRFLYPDIAVVYGERKFYKDRRDAIENPIVIIEVLSDSTASFDRAEKFFAYQRLPPLQAYVLAWQTEPLFEQYARQSPDAWIDTKAAGCDTLLSPPSIECTLSLAAVYDKVSFENL